MKRVALAMALVGCGSPSNLIDAAPADSDVDAIPASCVEAEQHSDLTWISENIFAKQCTFSGCHNGAATDAGKMDLRVGMAFGTTVGVDSHMCPGTPRVIAGNSAGSWMMKMLGQVQDNTPSSCTIAIKIGLMPMDNMGQLLCVQKRDAIQRWIDMGAQNN